MIELEGLSEYKQILTSISLSLLLNAFMSILPNFISLNLPLSYFGVTRKA